MHHVHCTLAGELFANVFIQRNLGNLKEGERQRRDTLTWNLQLPTVELTSCKN